MLIAGLLSGTGVGVNSAFPQGRSNKTYQFQDAFTRTGGRHTWKFGFDVGVCKAEQAVPFNSRGTINYNAGGDCGGTACHGTCNFIDDFSGSAGVVAKVFGSPIVHPDQNIQGYYAEDAWQVRPNFTLTLGVRYEFFGTPENVLPFPAVRPELGQFTDPFPTAIKQKDDRNNWAPRVSFAWRFSRGLLLRASYTYSKLIDNGSEVFTTSGGSSRVQDFANIGADRGLSAFDRRHRAVFTYVYDIPSWKPDHGAGIVLSQLIRDWQVSGTVAFQAGAPETICVGGSDTNNDGNAFNGRPNIGNLAAAPTAIGIDGTLFGVPIPVGSLYEVQNFLQCDVTIPCLPAQPDSNFHYWVQPGVGNVGRNTVITEGRQDWTFGLLRRIKMPVSHLEGQELEFRTEFFNPFNHPNRGIYSLDVFDPLFGDKDQTRAGGRQIRFWLKYRF